MIDLSCCGEWIFNLLIKGTEVSKPNGSRIMFQEKLGMERILCFGTTLGLKLEV